MGIIEVEVSSHNLQSIDNPTRNQVLGKVDGRNVLTI